MKRGDWLIYVHDATDREALDYARGVIDKAFDRDPAAFAKIMFTTPQEMALCYVGDILVLKCTDEQWAMARQGVNAFSRRRRYADTFEAALGYMQAVHSMLPDATTEPTEWLSEWFHSEDLRSDSDVMQWAALASTITEHEVIIILEDPQGTDRRKPIGFGIAPKGTRPAELTEYLEEVTDGGWDCERY